MAISLPAAAGPFVPHRSDKLTLREWAPANVAACLRRIEILSLGTTTVPEESMPDAELVRASHEVVVSYPRATNRFGGRAGLEATIAADLRAIDYYIGTTGDNPEGTTIISGPHRRERSAGVIFGVLPLTVVYWRAVS